MPETGGKQSLLLYLLCGVLAVAVAVFAIISVNLRNRMEILEARQENLVESANQSIYALQQQNTALVNAVYGLQAQVEELRGEANAMTSGDEETLEEEAEKPEETYPEETAAESASPSGEPTDEAVLNNGNRSATKEP